MALTAHPFHPTTGELLPTYRDAYLRGDLSGKNADLVDAYLKANPNEGDEALKRFYALREKGHNVRPVGWLQHQFHLMRTEPVRFRRRAGSIVLVGALLSGAVLAGTNLPSAGRIAVPTTTIAAASAEMVSVAAEATATKKMAVVKGRILDENGRPLVGATVLDKISGRGVTTNAQGDYSMFVAPNQASELQFGYGGYTEDEVRVKGSSTQNVTLLPRMNDTETTTKKRHWWQF
ncbi:carboxypeptidase-like regulatory domain-containing protein [Hymenobacter cellulosivorans]|uniref:Carboxypeptidase-like regulatory domain-containing protein n=1 Tax=Hymenobacter cellulosivorans TaxID=2932249 RepID=A0ABY4F8K0_9BACT|nr:carboxypeptidase-like regulatory domain-containing protein [Hymenobacter cellulosivorans]UOQ52352.1 carboxypeptidase-like regulatory domain-containing protein [Hymenobacter cellulosivorans]